MKKSELNAVRDFLEENRTSLSEANVQKKIESAYADLLKDLSKDARAILFVSAKEDAGTLADGSISWMSVFNSYVELAALVEKVRDTTDVMPDDIYTDLALEVLGAQNRMATLFYIVRKNPKLTEEGLRSLIEAAFPTVLNGVPEKARRSLFDFAYSRASSFGIAQVVEEYTNLIDLVREVKESRVAVAS